MPSFSTRSSASAVTSSRSMSFSSSCSNRMRRASETFTVRFFLRLGSISLSMSAKLSMPFGRALRREHVEHRRDAAA